MAEAVVGERVPDEHCAVILASVLPYCQLETIAIAEIFGKVTEIRIQNSVKKDRTTSSEFSNL